MGSPWRKLLALLAKFIKFGSSFVGWPCECSGCKEKNTHKPFGNDPGEGWGLICNIFPPLTLRKDYKVETTMGGNCFGFVNQPTKHSPLIDQHPSHDVANHARRPFSNSHLVSLVGLRNEHLHHVVHLLCPVLLVGRNTLGGKQLQVIKLSQPPPMRSIGSSRQVFVIIIAVNDTEEHSLWPWWESGVVGLKELLGHCCSWHNNAWLGPCRKQQERIKEKYSSITSREREPKGWREWEMLQKENEEWKRTSVFHIDLRWPTPTHICVGIGFNILSMLHAISDAKERSFTLLGSFGRLGIVSKPNACLWT